MTTDTLYITDLDGTLLGADSKVSPRSAVLINDAVADGAAFTIATARTPATVAPLLEGVDVRFPAIVMTGAAMWNPSTGIYSEMRHIDPDTVRNLLAIYRREGLPTYLYTLKDNHIDIYHIGPMSGPEREFMHLREGTTFKTFHVGADGITDGAIPEDDVILLFAMNSEKDVVRVFDGIKAAGIDCNPLHYHDTYGPESELMEVFGHGATKGEAVERLRAMTGARRIVAFGDNVNDLPMLRRADVAVAMANAVDEVKRCADIVIGPNTDDSVAEFIVKDHFHNK